MLLRTFCVLVVIVSTVRLGYGQQAIPFIGPKLYGDVIERVFEYDWRDLPKVVIRFALEEHWPELQIAFAPQKDAPCDVDFWYVSRGPATVWDQLQSILATDPTLSADQAARRIEVTRERRRLDCGSRLVRLLRRSSDLRLQPDLADVMFVHGSSYSLEFRSLSATVKIVIDGPPTGSLTSRGLHKWLNDLHVEAERYLGFAGAQLPSK